MRSSTGMLRAAWIVTLMGWTHAYPDMAGSCEGVFSGAHIAITDIGKKRSTGGWIFQVVLDPKQSGNTKAANISLVNSDPQAYFTGFLLKSFDLEHGKYIGKFSNLPPSTDLFAGCPVPEAAVHHTALGFFDCCENKLKVRVEWPADRELGFAFFPVQTYFEWYEVYGSTTGLQPAKGLDNVELYQNIFHPRLGKSAWAFLFLGFYVPMLLLVFMGAVAKGSNGPGGLGAKLNHTVPVSKGPNVLHMSLGEWMSHAFFYLVQGVILALMTVQIESEAKGMPYSEDDGIKWYPNPWDIAIARALGRLLQANLALTLLLPTRNSVWPALVGISFERCVKYHRIVGRWTFIVMVGHFVGMVVVYGKDVLMTRAGRWGEGNLYGTLAGISMLLMVLSSYEPVRRRSYELFLALHMMAFPMLIFSVLHVRDTLVHLILPLALYSADWVLRIYQWSRRVRVVSAEALPDGCTRLLLHCPAVAQAIWQQKADGVAAFVYLQHPGISKNPMEWHPFTVSGLEWTAASDTEMSSVRDGAAGASSNRGPPTGISVHIKTMGTNTWSGNMLQAVKDKQAMTIRAEGPYGHMGVNLAKYSHIVNVSGGIGFTPCAALLQLVLDPQRRSACLPLLKSMRVVWVVRTPSQLSWFEPLLARAAAQAASSGVRIDLDLYVSKQDAAAAPAAAAGAGARLRTNPGRPPLEAIMSQVAAASGGEPVAMLVCGPAALTTDAVTVAHAKGFHAHSETFLL